MSAADHYFQTTDALATSERKLVKASNQHGSPIKLPSKILAIAADPVSSDRILIAEAAGDVSGVGLEDAKVSRLLTEPSAPVTSLAVGSDVDRTLFAGCWDKKIYYQSLRSQGRPSTLGGHTDFVKCLLCTSLNGRPVVVSGGADAAIIVWTEHEGQFRQMHKLKGHTKALQDLAIDPLSLPQGRAEPADSVVIYSASSDREIRQWQIGIEAAGEMQRSVDKPILAHETSVYRLRFDGDGDLWTASADKTAKHLVRARGWQADTVLQHPDFVRDVVACEPLGLVATACRDEEIRVWDSASGDLVCTYSGHYEEVTGLLLLGSRLISVSIDCTIRRWSLERKDMARYLEELDKEEHGQPDERPRPQSTLTAEEEAELAELMDDSD